MSPYREPAPPPCECGCDRLVLWALFGVMCTTALLLLALLLVVNL